MTIENTLERIAAALEKIASVAEGKTEPSAGQKTSKRTAKTEPAKAEPAKAEPAKAEPAKAEPAKAEPVKEEPAKAEPAKAEPVKEEPAKAEPAKAEETGGITFLEVKTKFFELLNLIRDSADMPTAKIEGANLLTKFADGKALTEENIPQEIRAELLGGIEEVKERYQNG